MPEVALVVITTAKPGEEDYIAAEIARMMPHNLAEPGVINYEIIRDPANPGRFIHLETWASQQAFEAHLVTDHVQVWRAASKGKLEPTDVYLYSETV